MIFSHSCLFDVRNVGGSVEWMGMRAGVNVQSFFVIATEKSEK